VNARCDRSSPATASALRAAATPTAAQLVGHDAELLARRLLEDAGLVFVAGNVRYKVGELDLVMKDQRTLVFVEVRARATHGFGGAAGSIDRRKQLRLQRAANRFLLDNFGQKAWPACRFDVIAFEAGTPNWIIDAFDAA
jgi:putative endonuclease